MKSKNYIFQFETHPKKKGTCPSCEELKVFRYYEFTATGERLPEQFGKCERLNSCGHFEKPQIKDLKTPDITMAIIEPKRPEPIKFIDADFFNSTLKHKSNDFIQWLKNKYKEKADQAMLNYPIGTTERNETIFWYCDEKQRIRTGKIIKYTNGKRGKWATNVHSRMNLTGYYKFCLFGEHLIPEYSKETIICLAEGEKACIAGFILFPQYLWLSPGGANLLSQEKAEVIRGRKVLVIPDADEAGRKGAEKWKKILHDLNCNVQIVDLFEGYEDENDMADIVIKNRSC